jgi:beta-glucosidase
MTAYNPVNGTVANANWEAINGILRGEWGYDGVVMTDWWVLSTLEDEVHAGSDVKMPESVSISYGFGPETCDPADLLKEGKLDRGAVIASVRRILQLMSKLD